MKFLQMLKLTTWDEFPLNTAKHPSLRSREGQGELPGITQLTVLNGNLIPAATQYAQASPNKGLSWYEKI